MKDKVIQQYQADEKVMIQLFTQWCKNHDLSAIELYASAYPQQEENETLLNMTEETEKNFIEVETETVLNVLQLFGNEDLAFIVSETAKSIKL